VDTLPLTPTGKLARRRLVAMLDERRPAAVGSTAGTHLDLVLDCAARVLGDAGSIVPQRTFRDCGLTSLGAVRLANQLAAAIDRPLPSTVVFDHPTPARLAAYLDELAAGRAALPATTQPDPPRDDDPVVIVGIGCRLPGGVHSPDDFWALLVDGRDAVTAFPTDRGWPDTGLYDPEPGRPGRTYCRRGGFLDGAADFDPAFFNITPTEAIAMDPQQRLLLEVCWEALEHAGIDPHALRDTDTGVFVGMMASDYAPRLTEAPQRFDGQLLIGNSSSVASGRVAYTLGLRGPAITLDTACSSALVALHRQAVPSGTATATGRWSVGSR
jgi:hypothetical protein